MSVFDEYVPRNGDVMWLKSVLTPECYEKAGLRGFTGAEFEFRTCPAFSRGVAAAAENGLFGFTLPGEAYLHAVKWWMREVRGYEIEPDWIVPTHGTIYSLATTIRLLTEPGQGVIVMTPGYHRYEQAAARLGRKTVHVSLRETRGVYTIDYNALVEAARQPENKLLVLCNPNNPTGNIWDLDELNRIVALAEETGLYVFSDEIFAEIAFGRRRTPSMLEVSNGWDRIICCTGMGKLFSLTGVNHANVLIADADLRERYITQRDADHYGSLDPMVHAGLLAAYTPEGKAWLKELLQYLWDNWLMIRDFMEKELPDVLLTEPQGTYVVWMDFSPLGLKREELDRLLTEGTFLGDPGEEYDGSALCARYSIACPRREIETALDKLKSVLQR